MIRASQPLELSRRHLLGYGTASLPFVSQFARAQSALLPQGAPSSQPGTPEIATTTDEAHHLTIDVKVGGKGPFRFVVDTGADRSVIADDTAIALGLIRGPLVAVQGIVRELDAETVTLSDISFGQVVREALVVPVLPRALLRADGYLGLDAVDGSRVILDFRDKTLQVEKARNIEVASRLIDQVAVPVHGTQGHLRAVDCTVDGVDTTTFIDTGAEISIGNSHLFDELIAHDPSYLQKEAVPVIGVTGGQIFGHPVRVHRIHVNQVMFGDATILIADLPVFDLWGLRDRPALLIGMNFLRTFNRVSIDYGAKEILFDFASLVLARRG